MKSVIFYAILFTGTLSSCVSSGYQPTYIISDKIEEESIEIKAEEAR